MPPYVPRFTLPLGTRDYSYGMPTAMTAGLQRHTSMFTDNVAKIASLLSLYLASVFAISILGLMAQPQRRIGYALLVCQP